MSIAPQALERSVLEGKERDELAAIAEAMGAKPTSRASKAALIDQILREAGIETGGDEKPKRGRTRTSAAKQAIAAETGRGTGSGTTGPEASVDDQDSAGGQDASVATPPAGPDGTAGGSSGGPAEKEAQMETAPAPAEQAPPGAENGRRGPRRSENGRRQARAVESREPAATSPPDDAAPSAGGGLESPATESEAPPATASSAAPAGSEDATDGATSSGGQTIQQGRPSERATQGPSGPSERATQGPSGPSERATQGPSGPSERATQGPSGPSEREGQGPSGPSEREGQGPSGPSEREGQGPTGPSERETQGPSGPSERETQGPSGPSEREGQGPSGPSEREGQPAGRSPGNRADERPRERDRDRNRGQQHSEGGGGDPGNRRSRRRRGRDRGERGAEVQQDRGQDAPYQGEPVPVDGLLDLREEGYGFLRTNGYLPSANDVYVSLSQVRRFALRRGDHVKGASRPAGSTEKYPALLRIDTVNDMTPDEARQRVKFEDLTPLFPDETLRLEVPGDTNNMVSRIVDLISPIGKGQRGLIVSPPKAGKTTVLKQIAHSIEANNPETHLIVLLVDERPEEVTDMRRSVKGEVVSSTFDRPSDEHTQVAELTLERAKRLVELRKDVVIVLDGITRLARAYNLAAPTTGRIMSGGIDTGALYPPKKFFGAARNIEEGGSLTILATALVETGSKMDEVIFEEFKGTGNMELRLDRRLAERRIYPALDVNASSTRHEELLFERTQLQQVWKLRRVLNGLEGGAGLELLMDKIRTTKSNDEFLSEIAKAPTPAV